MRPTSRTFPPIEQALREPNGLLAVGGELSAERLVCAYRAGIFPWYEAGQPVLWWSPDPRAVIKPEAVHIARSLRKSMRKMRYALSMNRAFAEVMDACAEPRQDDAGTWITPEMRAAYLELHQRGAAHSIEVWQEQELVGGLYGVAVDKLFCGESMFSRKPDTSKIAFVALCRLLQLRNWPLLDCQLPNPHLQSLGVTEISRDEFKTYLPASGHTGFACAAL
ncbi:MAG: leucyl/phenylalanyl-tRNA--protein transferase, partial [Pseudomonadales bacterium]|nr:leucyl/phenylalanyl-tRNA--protein transferase [Pseudomonadales bacterium]